MAWILPLITIAADTLNKNRQSGDFYRDKQSAIEQERLKTMASIYQGRPAVGDFSVSLARDPNANKDNGLAAALQIAGGLMDGTKREPTSTEKAIDALGSDTNRLELPKLLDDYDPNADQWKTNVALIGEDPTDKWKRGIRL